MRPYCWLARRGSAAFCRSHPWDRCVGNSLSVSRSWWTLSPPLWCAPIEAPRLNSPPVFLGADRADPGLDRGVVGQGLAADHAARPCLAVGLGALQRVGADLDDRGLGRVVAGERALELAALDPAQLALAGFDEDHAFPLAAGGAGLEREVDRRRV